MHMKITLRHRRQNCATNRFNLALIKRSLCTVQWISPEKCTYFQRHVRVALTEFIAWFIQHFTAIVIQPC